jgi:acetate kinase
MTGKLALEQDRSCVLTTNGGSSSIKFALYQMSDPPKRGLHGKVDRIGLRGTQLTFNDPARQQQDSHGIGDFDHRSAANFLIDWLDKQIGLTSIEAVGHRVVNDGAHYNEPQRVTREFLDALRRISQFWP